MAVIRWNRWLRVGIVLGVIVLAALLERALIGLMLELHTRSHGYTEVLPPFIVNRAALIGTRKPS